MSYFLDVEASTQCTDTASQDTQLPLGEDISAGMQPSSDVEESTHSEDESEADSNSESQLHESG